MRKHFFIVTCAALAGLLLPGTIQGLSAKERLNICSMELRGARRVGKGEIKSAMNTQFPSFFSFLPWIRLPEYDETLLAEDERNIRALYAGRGYYQAEVTSDVRPGPSGRTVRVRIYIDEGRQATVESVEILFSSPVAQPVSEGAMKALRLRTGRPFYMKAYQDSKRGIEEYLGNYGFPDAKASGQAVVNRDTMKSVITLAVDTGAFQRFGPVSVEGLKQVHESDVTREITFLPGETFSADKLFQSQRNIYNLGVFDSVTVDSTDRSGTGVIPVKVNVSEAQKRRLVLGVGYGTEDNFRARASWSRLYFLNRVSTLDASLRYSSLLWSGDVVYTQPYFLEPGTSLTGRFGYDREFYVSYSNERVSSQVRVGRRLSPYMQGYVAYDLEFDRPVSAVPSIRETLKAQNPGDYYFISAMMFGIDWGTVRDTLDPRQGVTLSLASEVSTFLLRSDSDYLKMYAEARSYHEVSPSWVLAARAMAGFIRPSRFTKEVPIFKRFFLGGSNSVRGYPYQSIGPLNGAGEPTGGNYLVLGNLELRYPLYRRLKGVVFGDGGNVNASGFEFDMKDLAYAVGTGLRYDTPVGPVRLDLAFPVDSRDFHIARYSVYVSLGPMF
jgi:Outer membrane protein/protective antigen OMA87